MVENTMYAPDAELAPFASFEPAAAPSMTEGAPDLNVILKVPVRLSVELGRTSISWRNLLHIAPGSVIELDGLAGEPMDVLINGCLVAQGEIVVVNEKFGIRLTDIAKPAECIRSLKK